MKPTPKALDPAVFLKAAELIDSGSWVFSCWAINSLCGRGISDYSAEAEFLCAMFNPVYETEPHTAFFSECGDNVDGKKQAKHRVFALLLCAELCRPSPVRRGTPRGGKGRK